jgi:hypothetical protein
VCQLRRFCYGRGVVFLAAHGHPIFRSLTRFGNTLPGTGRWIWRPESYNRTDGRAWVGHQSCQLIFPPLVLCSSVSYKTADMQPAASAVVQESSSSEQAASATTTGFRDPRSPACGGADVLRSSAARALCVDSLRHCRCLPLSSSSAFRCDRSCPGAVIGANVTAFIWLARSRGGRSSRPTATCNDRAPRIKRPTRSTHARFQDRVTITPIAYANFEAH